MSLSYVVRKVEKAVVIFAEKMHCCNYENCKACTKKTGRVELVAVKYWA